MYFPERRFQADATANASEANVVIDNERNIASEIIRDITDSY